MDYGDLDKIGSSTRRLWLLTKAASDKPLDEALRIAMEAEAFIIGEDVAPSPEAQKAEAPAQLEAPKQRLNAPKGTILPEERNEIIARMAAGQKNAEIVPNYPHLTMRQIQGIRMGASKRIKAASTSVANKVPVDNVVRFLRQQDDVVVREGDGWLVNNRFRLSDTELLDRANRIRSRKQQPLFDSEQAAAD